MVAFNVDGSKGAEWLGRKYGARGVSRNQNFGEQKAQVTNVQ